MVDFFNFLYSLISNKNRFFEKLRINTFARVLIRIVANSIIPIYFRFKFKRPELTLQTSKNNRKIIVSLTTFPGRINRVWLVVMCMLKQSLKPDSIILWLSKEQFPESYKLPKQLVKLEKYGLQIILCEEDLRSHKKYLYAFERFPNDIIITVDDDVFYHSNLIANLIKTNKKFPANVCANHAVYIGKDNKNNILPYIQWKNVEKGTLNRNDIMPIGIGGVLYPPNAMHKDVIAKKLIKKLCYNADDIWLNAMTRMNQINVSRTDYNQMFLPIINYKNIELTKINVTNGLNDSQIKLLREYYLRNDNIDPFN